MMHLYFCSAKPDIVSNSFLVTTSKAPVPSSDALVSNSFLVTTSKAPVNQKPCPMNLLTLAPISGT